MFNFKKILSGGDEEIEPGTEISMIEGNEEILILEPRAFSESKTIVDCLIKGQGVIVNLQRVQKDQGKRIIDFLNGGLYALGGVIQKLNDEIFLCTPRNIKVKGEISVDTNFKKSSKTSEIDF